MKDLNLDNPSYPLGRLNDSVSHFKEKKEMYGYDVINALTSSKTIGIYGKMMT